MKNVERIFTFGCSWTNHWWPTWADIIRYSVDIPVYNWGLGGIGNVAIFHRLIECNLKNKFSDRDLILVQWSSWTREDRYKNTWLNGGNIFHNPDFDKSFIKKYWSWNNDVIKNCTAIISANSMFNIAMQTTMIPIGRPESFRLETQENDITEFYFDKLPKNIIEFPNEKNTLFYGNCVDNHPDPITHLYFYENVLRNKINDLPTNKATDMINKFQNDVSKLINNKMSFDGTTKIIKNYSNQFDKKINISLGF